jgi:hypothetical protein
MSVILPVSTLANLSEIALFSRSNLYLLHIHHSIARPFHLFSLSFSPSAKLHPHLHTATSKSASSAVLGICPERRRRPTDPVPAQRPRSLCSSSNSLSSSADRVCNHPVQNVKMPRLNDFLQYSFYCRIMREINAHSTYLSLPPPIYILYGFCGKNI